jgi:small subunit ribosomal protein S14
MAKKSILEREKKRQTIVSKYSLIRQKLLEQLKKTNSLEEKLDINRKLQLLPRNSASIRLRNRCWKTGRARGIFRFFGLCRNMLRKMAHDCYLPGIIKASW